uniref:Uncharacterized protein n=1 Tax=Naja naja TaxID=35670 RepID=A0A8C7E6P3_NAJNA
MELISGVCLVLDEIMHQDIVPLCAEDIEDELRKKFAYLSGGRGRDGSPVITFPEFSTFSEIPEKEFRSSQLQLSNLYNLLKSPPKFLIHRMQSLVTFLARKYRAEESLMEGRQL